jgi:nucleoside phosphorylase
LRQEGREFQEAYDQIKTTLAQYDAECATADIGVMIALEEEFQEFVELCGQFTLPEDKHPLVRQFQYGTYTIAATFVGDMGEAHATRVTEQMMTVWHPETIVTLGIAAAIHEDLRIGDVHIPKQTVQYIQNAKSLSSQATTAEFRLVPGSSTYHADDMLHADVRHGEYACPSFRNACELDLEHLVPHVSNRDKLIAKNIIGKQPKGIATGHVATGPVLNTPEAFSYWVRNHDRNIISMEMESSAAVWLAAQSPNHPTRSLAIRGISDYAGDKKNRGNSNALNSVLRKYAMRNAIRFLLTLLDREIFPKLTRVPPHNS